MRILILLLISLFSILSYSQSEKELRQREKSIRKFLNKSDFALIPEVHYRINYNDQDVPFLRKSKTDSVNIDSFFMCKNELSNFEYMEFINYLVEIGDTNKIKDMMPDTTVWRDRYAHNEVYVDYYLRHPAYYEYPVIGLSFRKALAYAEWRTKFYNLNTERQFKKVIFRLPTEKEWHHAAQGGSYDRIFPWEHVGAFDEEGKHLGNFRYADQGSIYRDSLLSINYRGDTVRKLYYVQGSKGYSPMSIANNKGRLNDNHYILSPKSTFEENGYGLFNMAGNVEEMVFAEDCDRESFFYNFTKEPCDSVPEYRSGITRGGSWKDPGAYARVDSRQYYSGQDYCSSEMGVRLVMEVISY
jgi:sulfatase modifying factor 1